MNLSEIRADTPGLEKNLFLNSAGSSLMPKPVLDRIEEFLECESQVGGYRAAEMRHSEIEDLYSVGARLFNCAPKNIAFAHDTSDAYAKILTGFQFKPSDVILTSNDDYVSNQLYFISLKQRYGIEIKRITNLENGDLDFNDLERLISERLPVLVSIAHIPTNSGLVQDVEKVGEFCQKYDIPFIVDACQSAGQMEVDTKAIGCDFLMASGRKFLRGPRGTGLMFISDKMLDSGFSPLFMDSRGAAWIEDQNMNIVAGAKRFENWEKPYALILGLKEAVLYSLQVGLKEIEEHNRTLISQLRDSLQSIPRVRQFDKGSSRASILTFQKDGASLDRHKSILQENNVIFSVSSKENALLDFTKKNVDWVIRLSPHYFNELSEIAQVCEIIESI